MYSKMTIDVYNDKISSELVDEIRKFDEEGISNYLNDPFTFTTGIVTSGDKIIAAGIIRVINELKVVIRPEISNIHKVKVLKLLLRESNKRIQCNEAIALITDGGYHYVNVLKNHFGFREESGVMLRLEREV